MATIPKHKALNILPQMPSKEDRKLKNGGDMFRLTAPTKVPGFAVPVPALTTILAECNDGWFAVVVDGDRKCYRLGEEFVAKLQKEKV